MQADSVLRKLIRMQLEMEEPLKSLVHYNFIFFLRHLTWKILCVDERIRGANKPVFPSN
jgi:hypothetical protein